MGGEGEGWGALTTPAPSLPLPGERAWGTRQLGRPSQAPTPAALFSPHPLQPTCTPINPLQSAAKRYRVTGGGKVMVRRAGKQHLNEKMSKAKKKSLGNAIQAPDSHINLIRHCLPYASIKK